MTRAAIISTSIYGMPNIAAWTEVMGPNDVMIIAGDKKSPHAATRNVVERERKRTGRNIRYVHPDDHDRWESSVILPWNCIQRRNIAILEALTYEPEFILTIDDDNYPVNDDDLAQDSDWLNRVHEILTTPVREFTWTESSWYNAGHQCQPQVTHRGFPPSQRHAEHVVHTAVDTAEAHHVGVFAALWLGDPDIDAVERIVAAPEVTSVRWPNETIAAGTWGPFNSQATAYLTALAPAMMCLPGVGRMDDIWASYVAQTIMDHVGLRVQYGHPIVRQDRNKHDLVRDLEFELMGYRYTDALLAELQCVALPDTPLVDELLLHVVAKMCKLSYVPALAIQTYAAWNADLITVNNEHADARLFDTSKLRTVDDR